MPFCFGVDALRTDPLAGILPPSAGSRKKQKQPGCSHRRGNEFVETFVRVAMA